MIIVKNLIAQKPYLLNTQDISPDKKDSTNLLKIVLTEITYYAQVFFLFVLYSSLHVGAL